MSKNTLLVIGLLVIVGVVAASQLMGKNGGQVPADSDKMVVASPAVEASPAVSPVGDATMEKKVAADSAMSDVQVIEIEAGAFYYKPNVIKVKKGQKVQVVFKSVDMMHDFNVDALNIKSEVVKGGNSSTFEFTANEVGTYEYYCSIGQHKQNGQIGTLVVEE